MANVDKIILEKGYDCEVELVAGATMPTFTSMNEKGMSGTPELGVTQYKGHCQKQRMKKDYLLQIQDQNWFREGWWYHQA